MAFGARISESLILEIAALIAKGNTIRASCVACGIHRDTYYDWLKRGRAGDDSRDGLFLRFVELIEIAEAEAEVCHVSNVESAGKQSWQASAWWLERRKPRDWARRPPPTDDKEDDKVQVIG